MNKKIISNGKIRSFQDLKGTTDEAIVFLHGNSLSSAYFSDVFMHESLQKFRRIALDLPGHGESSHQTSYEISDLSLALTELVSELALTNYWLVGHSLGGHVITQALPWLSPRGVLLVGTPPLKKPLSGNAFHPFSHMNVFYQEEVSGQELCELFSLLDAPVWAMDDFRKTDPAIRSSLAKIVSSGDYFDEEDLLSEFTGRLGFVMGESDSVVSTAYVQEFARTLGALYKSFSGDHHFLLRSSGEFADFVNEFTMSRPEFVSTKAKQIHL